MMMPAMITPMMSTRDPFHCWERHGSTAFASTRPAEGSIQHGKHCMTGAFAGGRGWLDDGAGVRAKTITQGALPEICQKLRYTQPHVASRLDPQQRISPARLSCNAR
jgi:hypothetical protein